MRKLGSLNSLTPGREIVWSSDRSGNLEIWIANADASGARQVTHDGVDAENPTATPDGEWIVDMTANPAHPGLWKIRREGSEATRLWEGAGYISELSPDGRYALFATAQNGVSILTVDIETGELLLFRIEVPTDIQRNHPTGNYGRARWTDGGRSIAFIGAVDNELGVFAQMGATYTLPHLLSTGVTGPRLRRFQSALESSKTRA